jgi:hypothetical protein
MRSARRFSRSAASVLAVCAAVSVVLTAQQPRTLFNTPDYRQDRDRWADPAYYLFNTSRELTDMQVDNRFGQKGSGRDEYTIRSPYPFTSSWEHYQAWLKKAGGGTKHTAATLPDWDGMWTPRPTWLDSRNVQAATVAAALTPQYREYFVQQAKAEAEGRGWWASAFCLPEGFARGLWRVGQFVVRPTQVVILGDANQETQVRWILTDRGHRPEDQQFPQWQGESIGFWDGNALVVHTNQIKGWNATHVLFEWSDRLTTVERYELVGNEIVGEVTLYDPAAFLYPLHAVLRFAREPGQRPIYGTCSDTNGPSSNIFAGANGILNEKVKGDPGYWDPNEARPWVSFYELGEKARPRR